MFLSVVNFAYAYTPFGGRILSTVDGVNICENTYHPEGPLTFETSTFGTGYPYSIALESIGHSNYSIIPGAWVLGFATEAPIDEISCITPETGTPYPTYSIYFWGSSL